MAPLLACCRDPQCLLRRTAHCAVPHPTIPHALLLFAGYGGRGESTQAYRNDLVVLRLDRRAPFCGMPGPTSPLSATALCARADIHRMAASLACTLIALLSCMDVATSLAACMPMRTAAPPHN